MTPSGQRSYLIKLMSDRGDHYRANVDEARKQAERSINPLDNERWLRIAEDWLKLAQSEDGRPRAR
jgi:hypothetical protein